MPSRNVIREFAPDSYYHIYNRGVEKRDIFIDDADYRVFLNLLKRYLSEEKTTDKVGRTYSNFYGSLELQSFCLMPNHFHLLIYVGEDERSFSFLMRCLLTSYTVYFNRRYKRVGRLFQGIFKASRITSDSYLQHISRYIHLNPRDYKHWEYSSLDYYLGIKHADWLKPERVLGLFDGDNYQKFVADYEGNKAAVDELKHELAN